MRRWSLNLMGMFWVEGELLLYMNTHLEDVIYFNTSGFTNTIPNILFYRCFASCIEQDFNPSSTQASNINVRNNPALHAELKSLLVILFDRFNGLVGSASEVRK